jgi:hypothetical protein
MTFGRSETIAQDMRQFPESPPCASNWANSSKCAANRSNRTDKRCIRNSISTVDRFCTADSSAIDTPKPISF